MRRGHLVWLLLLAAVPAAPAGDRPGRENVKAAEEYVKRLIEDAKPSVVAVVVSHSDKYPPLPPAERSVPGRLGRYVLPQPLPGLRFAAPTEPNKLDLSDPQNIPDNQYGSGVVLDDADGLILTAYHLIEGATKIYVRTSAGKGSYADIHAADARSDLAVLKLLDRPAGLKAVRIADVRLGPGPNGEKPTVAEGTSVISLGYPLGVGVAEGPPSASRGIVGGVRRRATGSTREEQRLKSLYQYSMLLQADVRITLGCSGAALLNLDGELIGLITPMAAVAGSDAAGGLAIPFDANYRRIVDVLRAGREVEYGFLGVSVDPTPGAGGLRLTSVVPGTPAALAGLAPGDTVLAIDGNPVHEFDELFLHIGAALAGTKIKVSVRRGPRSFDREVTLAKQNHPFPWTASSRPLPVHGLRVDYSSVLLAQQNAPRVGGPRLPPGVVVRDLEPGSPAEAKLKPIDPNRWLITKVNGKPVASPAEFYREAARAAGSLSLHLVDLSPNVADDDRDVRLP